MHLDVGDEVPDHCLAFSLSDPDDTDFREKCDHIHRSICDHCVALEETLKDIGVHLKSIAFPSIDEKDELEYTVQSAVVAIKSWKCHILRSARQDQARHEVLDILDETTVLIVNDWAMKFLPQKFRESQQDWF